MCFSLYVSVCKHLLALQQKCTISLNVVSERHNLYKEVLTQSVAYSFLLSSHASSCNLCLLERQHRFARMLFMYFLQVIVHSYIFV